MDLGAFLADDTFGGGSWADDEVDFSSISIPVQSQKGHDGIPGPNMGDPAFGGFERRERVEFPVPDAPPYRARLNNLPWDANEQIITEWLESITGENTTSKLVVPRDFSDPSRLKGNAYVNFEERDQLVKALDLSGTDMNGRRVYVSVAAPEKEGGFGSRMRSGGDDLDWGAARGGPLPPRDDFHGRRGGDREGGDFERRPRREEPDIDWSSARGSLAPRGVEPRGEPRERKPRREEPEIDWSSARGSAVPRGGPRGEPRERKPKKEEPELDWGAARSSSGSARNSRNNSNNTNKESHNRYNKKTAADEVDVWARGGQPSGQRGAKKSSSPSNVTKEEESPSSSKPSVVKSAFAVLADQDEDEEEESKAVETNKESKDDVKELESATAKLNVSTGGATNEEGGDWEVVGKN